VVNREANASQLVVHHAPATPCVGLVSSSPVVGEIWVSVNGAVPKRARLLASVDRASLAEQSAQSKEVLVLFERGDPNKPIIIGVMEEPLEHLVLLELPVEAQPVEKLDARVDGRRVVIEADEEIELKCGLGSIVIRKDGKIVIKGTNLLSRSSGPNRIRGGSINLN